MADSVIDEVFDLDSIRGRSVSETIFEEDSAHSWYLYELSRENFLAGRTDLKARGHHLLTSPNFPPTLAEVKARALRANAQYIMLEHHSGAIGEKKKRVHEDTRLIEISPTNTHDREDRSTPGNAANFSHHPAETLNATADSIRAARELLRELTPAQPMPQISREEIAAMISQALKDLTSQLQATKPDEKSEISRLRELMEFQQELLAQAIPQRGEPEISDKDRTLLTLMRETGAAQEFFRAMRELIATPEQVAEPANWRDRVLEVASQNPQIIERVSNTLERIVARILPNPQIASSAAAASAAPMAERSRSKMGRTSTTAAPTRETTEESPPATQAAEEGPSGVTLDSFVLGIKEDIQEGNDPDEAVADAATLFSEQPELGPIIIGLLEKSNEELFAVMHQAIGAKLDLLSNANEYLDGLRDGVRKRLRIPQNESS